MNNSTRILMIRLEEGLDEDTCTSIINAVSIIKGVRKVTKGALSLEDEQFHNWIRPVVKPEKNVFVLGLIKLKAEILVNEDQYEYKEPVMFQVRWNGKNWVDWCGDIDEDGEWEVILWLELPN